MQEDAGVGWCGSMCRMQMSRDGDADVGAVVDEHGHVHTIVDVDAKY